MLMNSQEKGESYCLILSRGIRI